MSGLEQLFGSSYVVKGRVVDARARYVVLELDDRSKLRVETGEHRIRADIRDPTEVRGTPYRASVAIPIAIGIALLVVLIGAILLGAGTEYVLDEMDIHAMHLTPLVTVQLGRGQRA